MPESSQPAIGRSPAQAQLHLPAARRHRVHDRHTEILFQQTDDRQDAPAGAEQIDRVGVAMFEERLLERSEKWLPK